MKYNLPDRVLRELSYFAQKYSIEKIILFGSRARGTNTERSDIDIAVCGTKDIEKLREELEDIPTLYTIDVVDMDECKNELLLEDIKQYGRKIYEKI